MFYISCFALLSCFHCFDLHFWDCMPDFDTYFYSPFLWDYVPYLYISTIYISLRLFAVFVYFPGSHFFEIFCRICIFLWFTFLWDCLPYLYISLVYISLRLFAVFVYFSGLHFFEIVCCIWIFLWFTFLRDCLPYLDISPPEANKCRPICHQGPPVHLPPCKELHRRKQIYKSINEKMPI